MLNVVVDKITELNAVSGTTVPPLRYGVGFFGDKMKIECRKCKKVKDEDCFNKDRQKKSGLHEKCKTCCADYQKNVLRKRCYWKKYKGKNGHKKRSKWAVRDALNRGELIKLPCHICDDPKVDAHHESYLPEHKLDVLWLCKKHHSERHYELKTGKIQPYN